MIAKAMAQPMKLNFILLSAQRKFLNLNENIGISLTIKPLRITAITGSRNVCSIMNVSIAGQVSIAETSEAIISAQDGVARPRKFSVCLVSILNLASLKAENTAISRAHNSGIRYLPLIHI